MAVQPVNPPVTLPPSVAEQLVDGFFQVLKQYWLGLILFATLIGLGVALYYLWKRDQEDKETVFEQLLKQAKTNARSQASPKRYRTNSFLTYGIFGITGAILGLAVVIFTGLIGVYFAPIVTFTMIFVGGVVERIGYPFKQSDHILLRYKKDNRIEEVFVGKYNGHYYGNDGFLYLYIYRGRRRIILREEWVLKIPQRYDLLTGEAKGKIDKKVFANVVQFTENSIIINHAVSLEKQEAFYYPTFISTSGEIIDNGLNYFYGDQRGAILKSNYTITDEYAKTSRKIIQLAPVVQYKQATGEEAIMDIPRRPEQNEK